MYIGFYQYTICFKIVSISCFCIYTSFGENGFSFQKIQVLENTIFVFKPNFYITKMVHIVCNKCLILVTHICYSKILQELIFVKFMRIYGN